MIAIQTFSEYYHYQHREDYAFKGHIHSKWEINLITYGEMEITYDDHIIRLETDMLLIGEPGAYHRSRVLSPEGAGLIVYQFFTDSIVRTGQPRVYHTDRYVQSLVYLLRCECEGKEEASGSRINRSPNPEACRLLELLLTRLTRNESLPPFASDSRALLFRDAIRFMEANLHRALTLGELALACQTSESQLKRIFASYTGTGAMAHFAEMKLAHAKEALAQGQSVGAVSEQLGFSSQAYFSLWFKKATGLPPKRYSQLR